MSWNIVLNKFIEIKNKAIQTGKDIWAYDSAEQSCLKYWVSLLKEGEYKERQKWLIQYLEMNEHEDFLLILYANYTDIYSGGDERLTVENFWEVEDGFFKECRSVVIDIKKNELVLTPFKKFWNLNERNETSYENISRRIKEASCVEISDKLDGSMQSARFYNGRVVMSGSQAINMENSWRLQDGYRMFLEKEGYREMVTKNPDVTFIFEYLSFRDAHVVKYEKEGLFLIGARDVNTGREANYKDILQYASDYDIPTTKLFDKTLDEIVKELDDKKSFEAEGFVLNIDGYKVKIKYNDYVYIHKALSAMSSANYIIRNIAEDQFDDFISKIPEAYRGRTMKIAKAVIDYKRGVESEIDKVYEEAPKDNRKDFMIWVTQHADKKIQGYVRCRYLNVPYNVLKKNQNGYLKLNDMGINIGDVFVEE